ncbi:MAG: hypothetical protein WCC64_19050, partial [Aliidongia sp.]
MQGPLLRFFRAARGAGVRISPAESMDALRAVEMVGYADRAVLKDVLALSLAKTLDEKHALDACFELYFSASPSPELPPEPRAAADGPGELAQMLLAGESAALATAMA